jgi:hypothetical protein
MHSVSLICTHWTACLLTYSLTHILTYVLTHSVAYLLTTPWSRVLDKLTGLQPVKKFPTFYWTRRFITAFTSARYLSVSWTCSIQSISPHPNSRCVLLCLSGMLGMHHVTRHNTPIHNILSTAPQLCISQKALGTLLEDGNIMPKHVGATIYN